MLTRLEPIKFADGTYQFGPLPLKAIIELERNCGVTDREGVLRPKSIYTIHEELWQGLDHDGERAVYHGGGAARASDIREILRLALIAGDSGLLGTGEQINVGPLKAEQLCSDYLYPHRPLIEGQYIAWAVLNAAIVGVSVKKKAVKPRARRPKPSPAEPS